MKQTKLFGFTRSYLLGLVICFGITCFCAKIYYGTKTKRLGGWFFKRTAREVIRTICGNQDFKFFGFSIITREDMYDLFD